MPAPVAFRWLGVAGLEIEIGARLLLIDPFITRPALRQVLFERLRPNLELVRRRLPRADAILVTHPHYDHLLDVPILARQTGAPVYGSPNTVELLGLLGAPPEQLHTLAVGDRLPFGDAMVSVLPGHHLRLPIDRWINGPLRRGLRPPLHALDYKMDCSFSFIIEIDGWRLQRGDAPEPCDALFATPASLQQGDYALLRWSQPRLVVPLHWDDFTRPAEPQPRVMFFPGDNGWMRLRRVNLDALNRELAQRFPAMRLLVPQVFARVDLSSSLGAARHGSAEA